MTLINKVINSEVSYLMLRGLVDVFVIFGAELGSRFTRVKQVTICDLVPNGVQYEIDLSRVGCNAAFGLTRPSILSSPRLRGAGCFSLSTLDTTL